MGGEKKKQPGLIGAIKKLLERRRTVRVERPGVRVTLKLNGMEVGGLELSDLSTGGAGLMLDFMPGVPQVTMVFESPEILRGFEASAQIRSMRRVDKEDDPRYILGYEFRFTGDESSQVLYRWLSSQLEGRGEEPARNLQTLNRASSLSGRRPEPSLVSSLCELKECAEILNAPAPHFASPTAKFFIAVTAGRVVAALPLIGDSSERKLPLDGRCSPQLDLLRSRQARLAQVWAPAFREKWIESLAPRRVPLTRMDTLFSVFSLSLVYAMDFARYTDLVVDAPPHLEEFFRIWMFERNPSAPGLMKLNLESFEARAPKERPELMDHLLKMRRRVELSAALNSSFQADPEFFQTWLSRAAS